MLRSLRLLTASCAAALCVLSAPAFAGVETAARVVELPDGRQVDVQVTEGGERRGVILFFHGANGSPEHYGALFERWAEAGWLVLSPLHVDSQAHPDRAQYTLQTAYPARLQDSHAAARLAAALAPGKPVVAAGHSYGSLMAAAAGGALRDRGGQPLEGVEAVLMMSSPGMIPGLITEQAYATMEDPLLVVTGENDIVPGFVPDPKAHLRPYETAPGSENLAVIYAGADHYLGLGGNGGTLDDIAELSLTFFAAHALGDAEAEASLEALESDESRTLLRK